MEPRSPADKVLDYFNKEMRYDPNTMTWSPSNPCTEIDMTNFRGSGGSISGNVIEANKISVGQIAIDQIIPGKIEIAGSTKLSNWRSDVQSTENGSKILIQSSFQDSLDVDFDEAVWRIFMPGVPKEDVRVFTVKDMVYVETDTVTQRKTFKLAEGESVKSTKLELGVLTVTIDRPNKRESIEIE